MSKSIAKPVAKSVAEIVAKLERSFQVARSAVDRSVKSLARGDHRRQNSHFERVRLDKVK